MLTTFSEALSPLIAILMLACSSGLMNVLFENIIQDLEDDIADKRYACTMVMYFVWLSVTLVLCFIVETQVSTCHAT